MSGDPMAPHLDARSAYRLPTAHCFESHPLRLLLVNHLYYLKARARDRSPLLTERGLAELKEGLGMTPAVRRLLAEMAGSGEIVLMDPAPRDLVEFEVPAYDGMTDFTWIPWRTPRCAKRSPRSRRDSGFWAMLFARTVCDRRRACSGR